MVGPVHWGAYPGEYLELAMAVLVAQDHPETLRRTPASGDGGIDLMVPDGDGYEVRQVKRFTSRLTGAEKRQIKESWETVLADPRLDRPITAYRLVLPLDPTPDEQAWFDRLVEDAPWSARWLGEVHWHSLASRHPHVIDYLFGGGRDQVAKRAMALQSAIHNPLNPITSRHVANSLEVLRSQLNAEDPHYRYEFQTSAPPPDKSTLQDCVLAQTQSLADGGFLTTAVYPKHRYSTTDAPIMGSVNVRIEDPAAAEQFQTAFTTFEHFGRALDLPEGMVSVSIDAPGGLGGTFEAGGGTLGPALVAQSNPPARLVAVAPDGTDLAELPVKTTMVTSGLAGGLEVSFVDASELLSGSMRISPPAKDGRPRSGEVSLHVDDITGQPVVRALACLRLVSALRPPNALEVRRDFGNQVLARALLNLGATSSHREVLVHLEDLAFLQAGAAGTILVPEEIDPPFANEVHERVRLLRGETITGTWDEVTLTTPEGSAGFSDPDGAAFLVERQLTITVQGEEIDLGVFSTVFASAKFADVQPDPEHRLVLVPGQDNTFIEQAGARLASK